jgi:site-specific recombinase XerD
MANIRNRNTRRAYWQAVEQFSRWCEHRQLSLSQLEPIVISAYIELLVAKYSSPTVKQHLAAIRMCLDWLVVGQVLPMNPAASVRGPKHVVKRGKTPVLTAAQARHLLDSIDSRTPKGLRDRALIAVMLFTFARVSAVCTMSKADYYQIGKRCWIRLHEKGGKHHEVPAHHKLQELLDAYLRVLPTVEDASLPLFRSAVGRTGRLSQNPLSSHDALRLVKRHYQRIGLSDRICCHTFRATGITAYLENGGTIEKAQAIAAHESPRTTKLYDRTSDELSLDEIERIMI